MNADALIDTFVRKINHSPRRRIREEDVPPTLREGKAEFGLYYSWTIQRFDGIDWIAPLEDALPAKLPPAYRSLVTRYIFPAFDIDSLILLANTGKMLYHEMSMAMAHDAVTSQVLLRKGLAQFAIPSLGDSDPVCFDLGARGTNSECPIVRVSHQDIIMNGQVRVMDRIAPSFHHFVNDFVRSTPDKVKA